jgi:superfamily II DNA or RNA helicase
VRARIAHLLLSDDQACERTGTITLKPHQQSAVARAEKALDEFGGVLLCDEVGMGKTFVATTIARRFSRRLVVAPAALASMWRDALTTTETSADFVTFERLSRIDPAAALSGRYDLVVVDEAHHTRNRATRRYQCLARVTRAARIILLTATPIHNRTTEMLSLLSLFLGSRAQTLTAEELARCVVRREHGVIANDIAMPVILPAVHRQVSDDPRIVQELMDLPPPLPVRDGGLGRVLIGRGLVHQWASSEAALHEAVRRRIAKAAALAASLESGNYPTARELETWTYGDGSLQLGFPELLSSPIEDASALLNSVRLHSDALREFHARHRTETACDAERAEILAEIRRRHPGARIVAFAQYAETVSVLFRRLSGTGGIAMLTARGGTVAGGKLTRDDTLARFAPRASHAEPPPPAERIDLLLTTDLLSEGVNLQDADVVVHLDVPWTAARMEQRVGRSARMGSLHPHVHVYLIRPPASAEAVLRNEQLVQEKWNAANRTIGSSAKAPFAREVGAGNVGSTPQSVPTKTERLRQILQGWRHSHNFSETVEPCVATVSAAGCEFIAAVSIDGKPLLISSASGCVSSDLDSQIEACLLCNSDELDTHPEDCDGAVHQIRAWFERRMESESAGVAGWQSRARKRLLTRIDSAIQTAPPHLRSARSYVAAQARRIATRQHGAALEAELEFLARSPLPDQEWLEAVARLQSERFHRRGVPRSPATLTIHALLLMRIDARRTATSVSLTQTEAS